MCACVCSVIPFYEFGLLVCFDVILVTIVIFTTFLRPSGINILVRFLCILRFFSFSDSPSPAFHRSLPLPALICLFSSLVFLCLGASTKVASIILPSLNESPLFQGRFETHQTGGRRCHPRQAYSYMPKRSSRQEPLPPYECQGTGGSWYGL